MRRKILKKKYKNLCKLVLGGIAFFSSMFINQHNLNALPIKDESGKNIANLSNVTMDASGNITLNSDATGKNGFMAWKDFSVGANETLTFPVLNSMLNYVTFKNPSLIYGKINAQNVDNFYIINPSGILFGPDSAVNTKNFYVSTRSLTDSQISAYIGGGDNYDIFANAGNANINNDGLKSSDIFGSYDVADGDVMFLGKVQADKLTVEGNTIQIRNTANMKNTSNGQLKDNDVVKFYSDNPIEVGYEVSGTENNKYYTELQKDSADRTNSATTLGWKAYKVSNTSTEQTIADYWLVNSAADLSAVNYSKTGNQGYVAGNYMLGSDIDLSSVNNFKALGNEMNWYDFITDKDLINFNGLNYSIKNLSNDSGLFKTFNGTIKNLRLENIYVYDSMGGNYLGGLIGTVDSHIGKVAEGSTTYRENFDFNTTIKNVAIRDASSKVYGSNYTSIGGIVGQIGSNGGETYITYDGHENVYAYPTMPSVVLENIENYADVDSNYEQHQAGGIVGLAYGGTLTINNSVNHGKIGNSNNGKYVGGIVGKVGADVSNLNISKVSNDGYISGYATAGGIVGYIEGYDGSHTSNIIAKIEESWNEGDVVTDYNSNSAGGIIGKVGTDDYLGGEKLEIEKVFNLGKVTSNDNQTYSVNLGGLIGKFYFNKATIKNSYNSGEITDTGSSDEIGGIIGYLSGNNVNIENVYNSGNLTGNNASGSYLGGLIGYASDDATGTNTIKNSYNVGSITATGNSIVSGGVIGSGTDKITYTNVHSAGSSWTGDGKTISSKASSIESIWNSWGTNAVDQTGDNENAIWRVYKNPTNSTDNERQPLFTAFMQNSKIERYSELTSAGSKDISSLLTTTDAGTYAIHDSNGNVVEERYKNTGRKAIDEVKIDVTNSLNLSSDNNKLEVANGKEFSKAVLYSTQFGHNLKVTEDSTVKTSYQNSTSDIIKKAGNSPTANTVYLKMNPDNGYTPAAETVEVTITVSGGVIDDGVFSVSGTYSANNDYINNLISDEFEIVQDGDTKQTTLKFADGGTHNSGDTYTVTKGGTTYTFTKSGDTYTYVDTETNKTYNVKLTPGKITTNYNLEVTVDSLKNIDGVLETPTGTGYTVTSKNNNNEIKTFIENLMSGRVQVYNDYGQIKLKKTDDTVTSGSLWGDSGETFTVDGTTYTIKVAYFNSANHYIVSTTDNEGNVTSYTVKLNPGAISYFKNYDVKVTVGDVTADDNGNYSLTGVSYTVTDNPQNGHSSGGNTTISNLLNGKVEVTEENGKLTLKLKSGESLGSSYYANGTTYTITKSTNGSGNKVYTAKTTEYGTTKTYNVELVPGTITGGVPATTTDNFYVKVTVNDRSKKLNGDLNDDATGYTVSDENSTTGGATVISTLLGGNVKVVETSDGKVTLQLTDGTPLGDSYTDGDGTTYTITTTTNESGNKVYTATTTSGNATTNYIVELVPGNLTPATQIPVTITVADGTITDGVYSGGNYDITKGSLDSGFTITEKRITVGGEEITVVEITYGGNTYTVDNLTQDSEGNYLVTIPISDSSEYLITIDPGAVNIINTPTPEPTPTPTPTPEPTPTPTPTPTPADTTPSTPESTPTTTDTTPSTPSTPAVVDNTPTEPTTPTVVEPVTPEPTITNLSVTVSVGDGTLTDGVFANTGYTIGNQTIKELFSGATVTYDGDRTILTNLPAGLTSIGNNQYTYTVTDPDGNQTIYTITIDPGILSIFNTPAQTTEPEIEIVTPEPAVEVTPEVQTVNTTIDEPDVELRSSNMEEFGGEKGDYVDLDLQDHTLIEVTDTNVAVEELNVTPEEFTSDAARNIVNNEGMELTSITDTPTADISTDITDSVNIPTDFNAADAGANIGGDFQAGGELDGGLSSLDSTSSNSSVRGNNGRGSRNENSFSGGNSASNRNSNGLSNTSNSSSNSNSRGNSASNRNSNSNRSANSTSSSNSNSDSDSGNSSSSDSSSSSSDNQNNGELGAVESGRSDSQQEATSDSNSTSENENSQGKKSDNKKSKSDNNSEEQNSDDEEEDKESDEETSEN